MKRYILMFMLLVAPWLAMAADTPDAAHQVTPQELARELQSADAKPLILNVLNLSCSTARRISAGRSTWEPLRATKALRNCASG